jgi:ABC-type transport system involved in multi-copper enzyme maturation permease subunit
VIPVLRLALVRARGRLASLSVGVAAFVFLVGLSYAAVDQNTVRELYESLPPALRAFSGASDIASPGGYLGSAFIHPVPLVIQGAVAISLASAPARDLDSGLAELILSRDLSRRAWLAAHAIATGLSVLLVGLAATAGALVAIVAVEDLGAIALADLAKVATGTLLTFAAVGGIALLCSAAVRSGARAVGWAAGITVIMYALNYLAQVWTIVEPLGPLSVFHYFDPGVILSRGELDAYDAGVLALVAIATTTAAHLVIARREIAG